MKTLGDVKVGESSTIVKLHGEGALRRHLMDLGLIKGCLLYTSPSPRDCS